METWERASWKSKQGSGTGQMDRMEKERGESPSAF